MCSSDLSKAIAPFLQSLPATARRLPTRDQLSDYLSIALDMMERTTSSVHGIHQTFPSPGLPEMFKHIATLLGQLSLHGLKNWVDYGVRFYTTTLIAKPSISDCNRRTVWPCCNANVTVPCWWITSAN